MSEAAPVVVLGDVMVDVVAHAAAPLARASDSPAHIETLGGGGAANTACWLAARRRVALVARVGADAAGDGQIAELRRAGVEPMVARDRERPTGTCVVVVEPGGERTMLPDRGANSALSATPLPDGLVESAPHLHVSGYSLLDPGARDLAVVAMRRAEQAGVPVSLDPSSAAPLRDFGAAAFLALARGARLLLPNADEAAVLTGGAAPEPAARQLARAAGAEVVVKCGGDGALWSDGDSVLSVPVADVRDAHDSTGAGDAFAAGLLDARLAGAAPPDALRAGHAAAAMAIERTGGRPPQPPLLHVATADAWAAAERSGTYAIPPGAPFVHLCLPRQLPGVLDRFFPERDGLRLLEIDDTGLDVRFETAPDGAGDFPHLHGDIPASAVREMTTLRG